MPSKRTIILGAISAPILAAIVAWSVEGTIGVGGAGPADAAGGKATARVPAPDATLRFEANRGQSGRRAEFIARGEAYSLYLDEAAATLAGGQGRTLMRMTPVGGAKARAGQPEKALPGVSHYLDGGKPGEWVTDVPHYARVHYPQVWPGIDLVYYGNRGRLQYDFELAPGADPGRIQLDFEQARDLSVNNEGGLVITTDQGRLVQRAPVVYQEINGERIRVPGHFKLLGDNRAGFRIGDYDRTHALVIDPVMDYASYLGGSNTEGVFDAGTDAAGNLYLVGITSSNDFPTTPGVEQPGYAGGDTDIFVSKFDPSGETLLYSTYIGGSGRDRASDMVVSPAGEVHVGGQSDSDDFPVVNAVQPTPAESGQGDGVLFKLAADGGSLDYSTYLGGTNHEVVPLADTVRGLSLDTDGGLLFAGWTTATDFPVTHLLAGRACVEGEVIDGDVYPSDLYAGRLNADGSLDWSACLGGNAFDAGRDIARGASGDIYLTGWTGSEAMPGMGPPQATLAGGRDAMVYRLSADGTEIVSGSYFGGTQDEFSEALALTDSDTAYFTGGTASTDMPTTGDAIQSAFGGGSQDAFVAAIDLSDGTLAYGSYLGGSSTADSTMAEIAWGLGIDEAGRIHVGGYTDSADFPLADPVQSSYGGGERDAFLSVLEPGGTSLAFSTYHGGSDSDGANNLYVRADGVSYLLGSSHSSDLPTVSPFQGTLAGSSDGFTARYTAPEGTGEADLALLKVGAPMVLSVGETLTYTLTVSNNGPDTATGVSVKDRLPPRMTFVAAAPDQGSCAFDGARRVSCSLGVISAGDSVDIVLETIPQRGGLMRVNHARVEADTVDPFQFNDLDLAFNVVHR